MRPILHFVALAFAALLSLPAAAQDAFPVTLDHAFGSTTIEARPERIVTIGWMSQDTVIALGIVPTAIPLQTWGGDSEGFYPWITDALATLGKGKPAQLDFAGGIPFEDILELDPDLILARYSGLTQDDYTRLSDIAPTVAYAGEPWQGEWRDITRTTAAALGEAARGEELIAKTEALIAQQEAAHPSFAGTTFVFGTLGEDASAIGVYVSTDPRVQLIGDLGLVLAPGAAALPTDQGWYQDVSFERLDTIDADLFIAWYTGQAAIDYANKNELLARYRPIAEGRHIAIDDQSFVMAVSAPSPLAIPWALDKLVPLLAEKLE